MTQAIIILIVAVGVVILSHLIWKNVNKKRIEARVIRVIPHLDSVKIKSHIWNRHLTKQEAVAEMLSGNNIINEVEAMIRAVDLIDRYDPVEQDRKIRELEKKSGIE